MTTLSDMSRLQALLDREAIRDLHQHPVLLLGRYREQFVREYGEWRIKSTELDVIWPVGV